MSLGQAFLIPKSHVPHILAIGASESENVFMRPRALPRHCPGVPRLPLSSGPSSGVLHVPVLPLALTSPAVPHGYLYNHSLDGVLKSLFPIPAGLLILASGSLLYQLSSYLCSSVNGLYSFFLSFLVPSRHLS